MLLPADTPDSMRYAHQQPNGALRAARCIIGDYGGTHPAPARVHRTHGTAHLPMHVSAQLRLAGSWLALKKRRTRSSQPGEGRRVCVRGRGHCGCGGSARKRCPAGSHLACMHIPTHTRLRRAPGWAYCRQKSPTKGASAGHGKPSAPLVQARRDAAAAPAASGWPSCPGRSVCPCLSRQGQLEDRHSRLTRMAEADSPLGGGADEVELHEGL